METWKEFEANELTHSVAHHLLAIQDAGCRYGGWARVSDIARRLAVTRGSVSIMLRSLRNRQLILTDEHRMVRLSPRGERIAQNVIAKKAVLKGFLADVLRVPEPQAEIDSCKIEHLISRDTAERLAQLMRFLGSGDPAVHDIVERFHRTSRECRDANSCPVCTDRCLIEDLAPGAAENGGEQESEAPPAESPEETEG
jgi:DtxR family Mn-dependent transcriptional regulator